MDAWWLDQCEPDNGALLDARHQSNFSVGKGIDYFNTYSLEHTKGIYKGWRNDIQGKRAFFLARQSFAGAQRNAATLWSSDIFCGFDSYKRQVPQGINAALRVFRIGLPTLADINIIGNRPIGRSLSLENYLPVGFSLALFAQFSGFMAKTRALFSNN